jgi:hypothetical protein
MTNSVKILFAAVLGLSVLLASGCVNRVQIKANKSQLVGRAVYVYGIDDSVGIKSSVKNRLAKLGFIVKENRSEADIIIDYKIAGGWDLIHYTITRFNLFMTDANSGIVLLQSQFYGDTLLSAEGVLDMVFDKIESELSNPKDS